MEFLQNNWFWIVLPGFFVLLQASGAGCCGSGRNGGGKNNKRAEGGEHQH